MTDEHDKIIEPEITVERDEAPPAEAPRAEGLVLAADMLPHQLPIIPAEPAVRAGAAPPLPD